MKIYLAGATDRRRELRRYAQVLRLLGHEVTSSWVFSDAADEDLSPPELRGWAVKDLAELRASDVVVHFSGRGGRGGRHVELGAALAFGIRSILVGEREHLFHHLEQVRRCDDALDLVLYLGRAA